MENLPWMQIVSYLIAIGIGVAGAYFGIFKNKLAAVQALINVTMTSIEDGKVTEEELKLIVAAAQKLLE